MLRYRFIPIKGKNNVKAGKQQGWKGSGKMKTLIACWKEGKLV